MTTSDMPKHIRESLSEEELNPKSVTVDELIREMERQPKKERQPKQENAQVEVINPFNKVLKEFNRPKKLKTVEGLTYKYAANNFMEILMRLTGKEKLEFDKKKKEILRDLVLYFMNDPKSKYDLSKGLYLYGDTGTGKTTILEAFSRFAKGTEIKKIKLVSAKEIVSEVIMSSDASSLRDYTQRRFLYGYDFAFDDLAQEQECKIYGTKVDCMEMILTARYNKQLLTHCTSNLKPERIKEKYDKRIYSRFHEMFNFIHIEGKDHRINAD